MRTLGEIIRDTRKSKGMTQTQLGLLAAFSRNYLSGVENGTQTISEERAREILAHLGQELVTVHYVRPTGERASASPKKEK